METDYQVLVAACSKGSGEATFGTIIGDCIQLIKHINPVLVRFSYRSANNVAHALAKATYSIPEGGECVDIPIFYCTRT